MAKNSSTNIHIQYNQNIYSFLNISIEDSNDGSVYITLMRNGESNESIGIGKDGYETITHDKPRWKKKRLSYHASGCVIYHDTSISSNYFEPVSGVASVNPIAVWSIPNIKALDITGPVKENDHIFELERIDGRVSFHILVAPCDFVPQEPHVSLRYEGLLSVIALVDTKIAVPERLSKAFVVFSPEQGLFDKQQLNNQEALIKFHQKMHDTSDLILYSPNGAGIYKIITAVPMRCSPKVNIYFESAELTAEVVSCKEHVITFKVKNMHGHYIKDAVPIKSITLDSEL